VGLGLVEEEHVWATRKTRRQDSQLALPTAQVLHRPLDVPITDTKGPKITASLAFEARSAQFCEAAQETLLALEHALHPAQVRGHFWRAKLLPAYVQLSLELQDLRPRRAHDLERRAPVALDVLG